MMIYETRISLALDLHPIVRYKHRRASSHGHNKAGCQRSPMLGVAALPTLLGIPFFHGCIDHLQSGAEKYWGLWPSPRRQLGH